MPAEAQFCLLELVFRAGRNHSENVVSERDIGAGKRDAARQQALAKIADLKAEYAKKSADMRSELSRTTAELARKSEELKKLAGEAAHRAVEIIRGEQTNLVPEAPMGGSSELPKEVSPQEIEDRGDDKEPDEEQ